MDERLRDREMGEWDSLTWRGIVARHPEEAERAKLVGRYFHRPPGGESWADICLRLRTLLADVARELPAHGCSSSPTTSSSSSPASLIEGSTRGRRVELVPARRTPTAALTTFERERGGGPRLERYNWTVPVREQGEPETRSEDAPVGR